MVGARQACSLSQRGVLESLSFHQVGTEPHPGHVPFSCSGRFGQVHKCEEKATGLKLAAKIIKTRGVKDKVRAARWPPRAAAPPSAKPALPPLGRREERDQRHEPAGPREPHPALRRLRV